MQRLFLLAAPAEDRPEARRGEQDEQIEPAEQRPVIPRQRPVGIGPPGALGVFVALQCVDRLSKQRFLLRPGPGAPALEDEQPGVRRRAVPCFQRRAVVGAFVEARQQHGLAAFERGNRRQPQRDIVRAGDPARAQQGMDAAGKRLALGPGAVDIVERERRGRHACRSRPADQRGGERRLARGLRSADAGHRQPRAQLLADGRPACFENGLVGCLLGLILRHPHRLCGISAMR